MTYVAGKQLEKVYPFLGGMSALIFGAFLPDLLDKPLAWILETPSRGVFHSAVVLSILFFALTIALPRRRGFILTIGIGAFLHILEDFSSPAFTFWPLLGAWPPVPRFGLIENLLDYYLYLKSPYQFAVEALSYPFFAWLLIKRKVSPQSSKGIDDTDNLHKEKIF